MMLNEYEQIPELGPDEDYLTDPSASFGIREAQVHRARGVNLAMFLGLFKYHRQSYRDLLEYYYVHFPFENNRAVAIFLERVFDRIELGYTTEWAGTKAETQIRELSSANLLATNEKTKMLTLIESLPIPAILVGENKTIDMANLAAVKLIAGEDSTSGQAYYDSLEILFPDWLHIVIDSVDKNDTQKTEPIEIKIENGNVDSQEKKKFMAYVEPMLDISEKFAGYAVLLVDVTKERADSIALGEAAAVFKDSTNAIIVTDPNGIVLAANPAMKALIGKEEQEVEGCDVADYLGCNVFLWPRVSEKTNKFWAENRWHGQATLTKENGEPITGWLTLSYVEAEPNVVKRIIGVFTDVSSLKASEEKFEYLSNHDYLTGLYNRSGFQNKLKDAIEHARNHSQSFALLFLDIDRFKKINDASGHGVGDQVLQQVGERLQQTLRKADTISHIGGDDFLAIVSGIQTDREISLVADKILSSLHEPMKVENLSYEISGSLGIATYPRDGKTVEALIRNADTAMYRAKKYGGDQYALYTPDLTDKATERLQVERELREAIRSGVGLSLAYQPLVNLRENKPIAVEALCRWYHKELGNIPPVVFIPIAEEVGLMPKLGKWVLEESLRQLAAWEKLGVFVPEICVNVSPTQLDRPEFKEILKTTLESNNISPARLTIEITEEALFRVKTNGFRTLRHAREWGVKVSIDDFGNGYSSLSRLQTLPVDIVKIDRGFIDGLGDQGAISQRAIAKAMTELIHAFNKIIVAEGIEDEATARYLAESGCEIGQGYLYARPLTPEVLAEHWKVFQNPDKAFIKYFNYL